MGIFEEIIGIVDGIVGVSAALFSHAKRTGLAIFLFIVVYCIILWVSIILYGVIYYSCIPAVAHVRPIYLRFPPSECADEYSHDPLCHFPSGNVSLVDEGAYELLRRGHMYAVEIALEMPESQANQKTGMFMIEISMLSQKKAVLKYTTRPGILHYKSYLFEAIYTLFYVPYLLSGSLEEKQVLIVPLFEQYHEDWSEPTHYIHIRILSKRIQIYSCHVRIHAQFTGFRYFMYYWPVLSAAICVSSFFFTICVFMLVVLLWWLKTSQLMNIPAQVNKRLQKQRERQLRREAKKKQKARLQLSGVTSTVDDKESSQEISEKEHSSEEKSPKKQGVVKSAGRPAIVEADSVPGEDKDVWSKCEEHSSEEGELLKTLRKRRGS